MHPKYHVHLDLLSGPGFSASEAGEGDVQVVTGILCILAGQPAC